MFLELHEQFLWFEGGRRRWWCVFVVFTVLRPKEGEEKMKALLVLPIYKFYEKLRYCP